MNITYYFSRVLFRVLFYGLYRHQVIGEQYLIEGPAIIAANHASYLDPPLLSISTKEEIHFLAKAPLFRFPFFSWMIRKLNAHPIGEKGGDLATFKLVKQLLSEGHKVVIFPEGVRSETGELLPIKTGIASLAITCRVPIIPAYIGGTHHIWPRTRRFPRLHGRTSCRFGPPISWQTHVHLDRKSAQEAIATQVADAISYLRDTQ